MPDVDVIGGHAARLPLCFYCGDPLSEYRWRWQWNCKRCKGMKSKTRRCKQCGVELDPNRGWPSILCPPHYRLYRRGRQTIAPRRSRAKPT